LHNKQERITLIVAAMKFDAGNRYTDGDGDNGMEDVEDFSSEYYENQPGDIISNATRHQRTRRISNKGLTLLTVISLMILVGSIIAIYGGGAKKGQAALQSSPAPTAPTDIEAFVTTLVGAEVLQDPDSLASKALEWLEETHDEENFDNERLQQRFALACLYLSTSSQGWKNKHGWLNRGNECNWYGVLCKHQKLFALNLTDNGLDGTVPMEIRFLRPSLEALVLSRNIDLVNKGSGLAWLGKLTQLRKFCMESLVDEILANSFLATALPILIVVL
jgi:hypothetical protein